MAGAKRKAGAKAPAPDLDALVAKATAELERSQCLALSKLGPAALRPAMVERLVAIGYEKSGTQLRKPLAAQLHAALEDGATIALNGLKSHVAGASAADLKRVIQEAVAGGSAVVVLRGKQAALTRLQAGLIAPDELRQLKRTLEAAQKALGAALAAKPPASLLRSDLQELLPRLTQTDPLPSRPAVSGAAARSPLTRVLQAVADSSEGSLGLAFVPRVIAKLTDELSPDAARQALLEAAKTGSIELRPEGGLARLSQAELDLCPKGPMGVALAWTRLVEDA